MRSLSSGRIVRRRFAMIGCGALAIVILNGCLTTWKFRSNDKTITIVNVDACVDIYPLGYQMSPGDTVKFINHGGGDVRLQFPAGTVTAQDEDVSTPEIEATIKKGRKKRITISDNPPLTPDANNNGVIVVTILDDCLGGANMIIQPPN